MKTSQLPLLTAGDWREKRSFVEPEIDYQIRFHPSEQRLGHFSCDNSVTSLLDELLLFIICTLFVGVINLSG